jgi:hypothetical protein
MNRTTSRRWLLLLLPLSTSWAACGDDGRRRPDAEVDAMTDSGVDDASSDADAAVDTGTSMDTGAGDATMDASDATMDASDAAMDASDASDATMDASDATADSGVPGPPMLGDVHRFGAAEDDHISAVVVGADGTVFAGGSVRSGTISIGTFTLPSAGPGSNLVFFALAPDGSIRWAHRLPGPSLADTGTDPSTALDLAADGTVWAAGYFAGAGDLGDGVTRMASWSACFVLTFDPTTGASSVEGVHGGADMCRAHDLAVRPGGGYVLLANCNGGLDLGGGALDMGTQPSRCVGAFDATGAHVWSRSFDDAITGRMSIDGAGNVYVCGGARATTDIGDGVHTVTSTYSPFISSFTPAGALRWATIWNSVAGACYSVAANAAGRTGVVFLDNGAGSLTIDGTTYSRDDLLIGVSAAGAADWARPTTSPWGFARRGEGNSLLLTGFVMGDTDFGGGTRTAPGSFDTFAASYDFTTGAHEWSGIYGSTQYEIARSIAPSGGGGVWVGGTISGTATPFITGDFGERDLLLFEVTR